jgi:hypothetical protein
MPTTFTGGCACGAIRYEVSADPIVMFNCHCRDCQKTTGGPYTPVFYVPAKAFKITKGSPKYYDTTSEMVGHNRRGFCPECGSRLFGGATDQGQGITASSLDDPTLFNRSSKFGRLTRNPGTTWTRSCKSSRNMLRANLA